MLSNSLSPERCRNSPLLSAALSISSAGKQTNRLESELVNTYFLQSLHLYMAKKKPLDRPKILDEALPMLSSSMNISPNKSLIPGLMLGQLVACPFSHTNGRRSAGPWDVDRLPTHGTHLRISNVNRHLNLQYMCSTGRAPTNI